jgi:mannan endo-1,4-beta-mannosidase
VFNDSALLAADYAIHLASLAGLRLVVPLTDPYDYYHGSLHDFEAWLGAPKWSFWTNDTVIAAFERYLQRRLTHVNPFTGEAEVA